MSLDWCHPCPRTICYQCFGLHRENWRNGESANRGAGESGTRRQGDRGNPGSRETVSRGNGEPALEFGSPIPRAGEASRAWTVSSGAVNAVGGRSHTAGRRHHSRCSAGGAGPVHASRAHTSAPAAAAPPAVGPGGPAHPGLPRNVASETAIRFGWSRLTTTRARIIPAGCSSGDSPSTGICPPSGPSGIRQFGPRLAAVHIKPILAARVRKSGTSRSGWAWAMGVAPDPFLSWRLFTHTVDNPSSFAGAMS